MRKLLGIVGARPQFIKAAAIEMAAGAFRKRLRLRWLHTGQHYDKRLSDVFFSELRLPKPAYRLKVGAMTPGAQTGAMLDGIEAAILKEKPDAVLVFGDTNSTLAGALAAAKLQVPVAHVEAGLRSFNRAMPEEANRVITDHLSSTLFCPTASAVRQLKKEGIAREIHCVGDVMADLLMAYRQRPSKRPWKAPYYLATIHRNTNTDDPRQLARILEALERLRHPVVMPLHPRTRDVIGRAPSLKHIAGGSQRIRFVKPLSYFEMLAHQRHAEGVITDSGGVQKEAFLLGVPCVTLRRETEWTETVRAGANTLCAPEAPAIQKAFDRMKRKKFKAPAGLYGGGKASRRILEVLSR